jgi:hypothetical protein
MQSLKKEMCNRAASIIRSVTADLRFATRATSARFSRLGTIQSVLIADVSQA